MALAVQSVKNFINDSYQLISANSPTVPLQGNDQSKGLQFLNELIDSYSATGLLLTVPKEINFQIVTGQTNVTFTDPTFSPPPTSFPNIAEGRLANLENAFLLLDGVTYPMYDESRNTFKASYKFDPLQGLPRFVIVTYFDNYTDMRLYPAPSQPFQCFVFGKFQLSDLTINGDMSGFPTYYIRFLRYALAKDLAFYKGRSEAWGDKLEAAYIKAEKEMQAVSPMNLNIESDYESLLNGSWRVRAGV